MGSGEWRIGWLAGYFVIGSWETAGFGFGGKRRLLLLPWASIAFP
jgi:hypothetical protein